MPQKNEVWEYYLSNNLSSGRGDEYEYIEKKNYIESSMTYVSQTFDPQKGKSLYIVGEYIEDLTSKINTSEIDQIILEQGYPRKIHIEDLDVVAGYQYICVVHNQKAGRELTVPTKGLIEFAKHLKNIGDIKTGMNFSKIKICREILKRIGYITCLDNSYLIGWNNNGVAMRFGIGEQNPRYSEYLVYVPSSMVHTVINDAQARCKKENIENSVDSHNH